MDAPTATVIGALIAATASITVAIVTSRSKSEKKALEPELPLGMPRRKNWTRTSGWLAVLGFYLLGVVYLIFGMYLFSVGLYSYSEKIQIVAVGIGIFIPGALIHVRLMR